MSVGLAAKLSILKFANTSLIFVAVHQNAEKWFSSGNLVYDVINVLGFAAFASLINLCILLSTLCMNSMSKCCASDQLTQMEANKLYEHPPFDVENNISDLMNLILSCLFYAPLVPLSLPICFIGILVNYLVSKCQLSCLNKMPDDFGSELTTYFADMIPYASITLAAGYYTFSMLLAESITV